VNFLNLSAGLVGLGVLALAGGLFLLQQLRVRQREVDVVTTLFWRQALEESRARVLRQRFRHPWAYLLLLAIASLLWLAVAGLMQDRSGTRPRWLLLDASAGMNRPGRFEAAKESLLADVAALPAAERQVFWCGETVERLLAPGEETPLLRARLERRRPQAAPARLESWLSSWTSEMGAGPEIRVYGDGPLRPAWLGSLPAEVSLLRRTDLPAAPAESRGILAAGIGESASGQWDQVDVTVAVGGLGVAEDALLAELSAQLGGEPWPASYTRMPSGDPAVLLLRFSGIPARGQDFQVKLGAIEESSAGVSATGDLEIDDHATLALPSRRPLRVAIAPALASLFQPLLEADPSLILTAENPGLQIRRTQDPADDSLPSLVITADDGGALFRLRHDGGADADAVLEQGYRALGLGSIDALGLATALHRPVSVDAEVGSPPQLQLSAPLLLPEAGFTASRAFPLLITRGLRWLHQEQELLPYAAAGRPLPGESTRLLGAPRVVGAVGDLDFGSVQPLHVSLYDPGLTMPQRTAAAADPSPTVAGRGLALWTWAALVALLLLVAEGFLFQRGRLP